MASDESLDLQGEVTLASGLKASLPYLRKFGKFNDDHGPVDVGEVVNAEVLTKGELARRGILDSVPPSELNEEALYVGGPLYRHVARGRYYRDVLRSGGRLGLSVQGAVLEKDVEKSHVGRRVAINKKCFINKIAITDQPVNPNTWVALAKSLGAQYTPAASRRLMQAICKAITTGSAVVQPGDSGTGAPLRIQSLEGSGKRRAESGARLRTRKHKPGKTLSRKQRRATMEHDFKCELREQEIAKSFGGLSAEDVRNRIEQTLNPSSDGRVPATVAWSRMLPSNTS